MNRLIAAFIFSALSSLMYGPPEQCIEDPGCTNEAACNFDPLATDDDGSCVFPEAGYDCDGNCADANGDGVCDVELSGCTDETACNYNPEAIEPDGSCLYPDAIDECGGDCAADSNSNGICDTNEVPGCTYAAASNFNAQATLDDGTCSFDNGGGNSACASDVNDDGLVSVPDILLVLSNFEAICEDDAVGGCTNSDYVEYNSAATIDDGSCATILISGCTDSLYFEYSPLANQDDGSCATFIVPGCTYPVASNYNNEANIDDGSCTGMTDGGPGDPGDSGAGDTVQVMIPGTEVGQTLYWDGAQWALLDIGISGESLKVGENQLPQWSPSGALSDAPTIGCHDPASCNYDPTAEIVFNELCDYETCYGCTDSLYLEFDALHTFEDSSCATLVVPGCTDPTYLEFDPTANQYDGSCATLLVQLIIALNTDNSGSETSWTLIDDATGLVIASGSGYSNNSAYDISVDVAASACYTFTISDSANDGVCCGYGQGNYSLT